MLTTPSIGFDLPPAFNGAKYEAIHARMASCRLSNENVWGLFATGWNGVAYRTRAAIESQDRFSRSVAISTSPSVDTRFSQETDFFLFFASVVSAIESFHFGAYCIAAFVDPVTFTTAKDQDLRIYPNQVHRKFLAVFPSEAISATMNTCQSGPEFREVYAFRDVLSHRGMLPRRFYEGGPQSGLTTIPANPKDPNHSWSYSFEINDKATDKYLAWLLSNLSDLFRDLDTFCGKYL